MSLRKQVRSKKYMDETFDILNLGEKSRYGRNEFEELKDAINDVGSIDYVGGVGTADEIDSLPWVYYLYLNGGECVDCGNAPSLDSDGVIVSTGTTTEGVYYDIPDVLYANLDKTGTDGYDYSYDVDGNIPVGEEDLITPPRRYNIYVQWIEGGGGK